MGLEGIAGHRRLGRRGRIPVPLALIGAMAATASAPLGAQGPVCRDSQNIPLTDLATSYRGLDFGLYPGRRTTPPDGHLAAGLARAKRIQPLDVNGRPDANGKIVLMSLGMSNTSSEFARFVADARGNPAINRHLAVLNGSLSGADAAMWADPASRPWQNAVTTASGRSGSVKQVQVLWIKQAHVQTAAFPGEVEALASNLRRIVRTARMVFPNLQIVYLSSRTRSGAETRRGPGEPQAYETAFAVRRLIAEQIAGTGDLSVDSPWLAWGPYLWSNGTGRSDGFVWDCGDLRPDLLHPSDSGSKKVSDQLMAFFMTADTAMPWFVEPSLSNRGPTITGISPSIVSGKAPLAVDFTASVSGAANYFWSFGDGTFSNARNPRKTFRLDGVYRVQLTVTDPSGRWAHSSLAIRVGTGT